MFLVNYCLKVYKLKLHVSKKDQEKWCISVHIRLLQLAKKRACPEGYCQQFLFTTCFIKETTANANKFDVLKNI